MNQSMKMEELNGVIVEKSQKSNFESRPVGHVMLSQTLIEVVFQKSNLED